MSAVDRHEVLTLLKEVKDPELNRDIVSLGMLKDLSVDEKAISIQLELTSPSPKLQSSIEEQIKSSITTKGWNREISIGFLKAAANRASMSPAQPIPGVKYVVAVASGKGGVGKSTVSVNLALALSKQGYKVGLMDGDIYGPNIPLMLGVQPGTKPTVGEDEKMIPIDVQGIKMISMGVLIPADQPMVWRGPMLHSAVTQFLQKVDWGELDYLLVDLPPGTGDVQLSLVQAVSLTGAVIVTTPQEVALMDVRKGIGMFQKTNVPILGVVENMSGDIFGEGGGETAAKQFGVAFLGRVPLHASVREGGDEGAPVVVKDANNDAAKALMQAASEMATVLQNK